MATKRKRIPRYSKVQVNGYEYYKTDIEDADGKRIILYGKTREEVYDKEMAALEQIDNATFRRKSPTVAEYCEKWLLMQSVHVRTTTLTDYTSKVRRHIIKELGEKRMAEVTLDDIQVALVPVSKKSASVYKSVVILYKSKVIDDIIAELYPRLNDSSLSDEEKDEIRRQIAEYKKYASLVQTGRYYRLTDPQTDNQGAWEFVSEDQKEALVQVVGIKKHANMTVDYIKVKGLKENTMYRDTETGRVYNSTALREAGIPKPVLHGEYQAYQWHFVCEE